MHAVAVDVSVAEPSASTLAVGGLQCALWTWPPAGGKSRGLCVLFHGLGAHGRFPSVKLAAVKLALGGFTVVCPDFPGHGESEGQRGYIASADALEEAAFAFVTAAQASHVPLDEGGAACPPRDAWCVLTPTRHGGAQAAHPEQPLFLAGSSMGGVCTHVCLQV